MPDLLDQIIDSNRPSAGVPGMPIAAGGGDLLDQLIDRAKQGGYQPARQPQSPQQVPQQPDLGPIADQVVDTTARNASITQGPPAPPVVAPTNFDDGDVPLMGLTGGNVIPPAPVQSAGQQINRIVQNTLTTQAYNRLPAGQPFDVHDYDPRIPAGTVTVKQPGVQMDQPSPGINSPRASMLAQASGLSPEDAERLQGLVSGRIAPAPAWTAIDKADFEAAMSPTRYYQNSDDGQGGLSSVSQFLGDPRPDSAGYRLPQYVRKLPDGNYLVRGDLANFILRTRPPEQQNTAGQDLRNVPSNIGAAEARGIGGVTDIAGEFVRRLGNPQNIPGKDNVVSNFGKGIQRQGDYLRAGAQQVEQENPVQGEVAKLLTGVGALGVDAALGALAGPEAFTASFAGRSAGSMYDQAIRQNPQDRLGAANKGLTAGMTAALTPQLAKMFPANVADDIAATVAKEYAGTFSMVEAQSVLDKLTAAAGTDQKIDIEKLIEETFPEAATQGIIGVAMGRGHAAAAELNRRASMTPDTGTFDLSQVSRAPSPDDQMDYRPRPPKDYPAVPPGSMDYSGQTVMPPDQQQAARNFVGGAPPDLGTFNDSTNRTTDQVRGPTGQPVTRTPRQIETPQADEVAAEMDWRTRPKPILTEEELRDLPTRERGGQNSLELQAHRWGVAFDAPSTTIPRILDAQQRWQLGQMSDKELWDAVRAQGLRAGSRQQNIETLMGGNFESPTPRPRVPDQTPEAPIEQRGAKLPAGDGEGFAVGDPVRWTQKDGSIADAAVEKVLPNGAVLIRKSDGKARLIGPKMLDQLERIEPEPASPPPAQGQGDFYSKDELRNAGMPEDVVQQHGVEPVADQQSSPPAVGVKETLMRAGSGKIEIETANGQRHPISNVPFGRITPDGKEATTPDGGTLPISVIRRIYVNGQLAWEHPASKMKEPNATGTEGTTGNPTNPNEHGGTGSTGNHVPAGESRRIAQSPADQQRLADFQASAVHGNAADIKLPAGKSLDAHYAVVDADHLTPSHDARKNFSQNAIGDPNERPYHDPREGAASRAMVERIAANPDASLLHTDTPTATDGPPIVSKEGIVYGGNGRTMGMQLAYHKGGQAAESLGTATRAALDKFGIDPKAAEGIRHPVIVRVVHGDYAPGELSRILNEALTTGKSASTDAVSRANKMSEGTVERIGRMLSSSDESPSLRELLASPDASGKIVRDLVKDGVWSESDVTRFTDGKTGALNEEGKLTIERTLLGRILDDPGVMAAATPKARNNVMAALPELLRAIDAEPKIKKWLFDAVASYGDYKNSGESIEDYYFRQQSMQPPPGFGDRQVAAIVRGFDDLGPRKFKQAAQTLLEKLGASSPDQQGFGFAVSEKAASPERAVTEAFGEGTRPASGNLFGFGGTPRRSKSNAGTERAPASGPDRNKAVAKSLFGSNFGSESAVGTAGAKMVRALKGIVDFGKGIKQGLAPTSVSKEAATAHEVYRSTEAQIARRFKQFGAQLAEAASYFDRKPREENYQIIDDMQHDRPLKDPAARKWEEVRSGIYDQLIRDTRAIDKDALQVVRDNYFPGIWKKPEKVSEWLAQTKVKSPIQGSRGFMKKKTFDFFADAIKAGFEPVSDNPVHLDLMKMNEMLRFIHARGMLAEFKGRGITQFVRLGDDAPVGWNQLNDKMFTVYGPPTVKVSEYIDKPQMDALVQVMKNLSIAHERTTKSLGREVLGLSDQQGSAIETKFGSGISVIAHEIGHQLDAKYDLGRHLVTALGEPEGVGVHSPTQPPNKFLVRPQEEFDALSNLRYTGNDQPPPAKHQAYNSSRVEQLAQVVEAYVAAPERMKEVAPRLYELFKNFVDSHPELAPLRDVRPSLNLQKFTSEQSAGGMVTMGHYYMPSSAAYVINQNYAPGLRNHPLWKYPFNGLMGVTNAMNTATLGMSAFHVGFEGLNDAVGKAALAMQKGTHGDFKSAAGDVLEATHAPVLINQLVKGSKVLSEYLRPGSQGWEMAKIVNAAVEGGMREGRDSFYGKKLGDGVAKAFANSDYVGGVAKSLIKTFEYGTGSRFIFDYMVPRLKAAAIYDLGRMELDRLGPDATPDQVRKVMGKVVDTVDNRYGQMVYDNLAMNKVAKDLLMATVGRFGWQLGTIREMGGGVLDLAKNAAKIPAQLVPGLREKVGKPELSPRAAFVLATPLVIGALGAVTNYLYTGQFPKSTKDYFMPRTGDTDQDGQPVRVMLPSYLKDSIHAATGPKKFALSKINPALTTLWDIFTNKDFYGTEIVGDHADAQGFDKIKAQAADVLKYLGLQFTPYAIQNQQKMRDEGVPLSRSLPAFVGVSQAPKDLQMSAAESKALDFMQAAHEGGAMTQEQSAAAKLKARLANDLRAGKPGAETQLDQAIESGTLRPDQAASAMRRADQTRLQRWITGLTAPQAMEVWKAASPEERQSIREDVLRKISRSRSLPFEKKQKMGKQVDPEFGD